MTARKKSAKLSPREVEILNLIADGNTNQEIGEKLEISHHTVAIHRQRILKKVGVNNTVQLIIWGMENGYL